MSPQDNPELFGVDVVNGAVGKRVELQEMLIVDRTRCV